MAVHPAGIQNPFLRHAVWWMLFLPMIALLFTPFFAHLHDVEVEEVQMVASLHPHIGEVHQAANDTFTRLFIVSGWMAGTERFFTPSAQGPVTKMPVLRFAQRWMNGFWRILYKGIWRWYALSQIVLKTAVFICIPAAVDGFMVRSRKQFRFQNYKPLYFESAIHVFILVFGLCCFLPLAPFALSRTVICALLAGLLGASWLAASNFQTGK